MASDLTLPDCDQSGAEDLLTIGEGLPAVDHDAIESTNKKVTATASGVGLPIKEAFRSMEMNSAG